MGYLSQEVGLPDALSVREYLFDMDSIHDWEQELELNIAINKLHIKPYLDQKIGSLS